MEIENKEIENKEAADQNKPVEIKRFEANIEAKLLKALSKIFDEYNNVSELDSQNNGFNKSVDPAHVCMVTAKTQEAKRVLSRFVNKECVPSTPTLDYIVRRSDVNKKYTSNYSTDYMNIIFNVLKVNGNFLTFSLKEDHPAKISNEHFEFLLAPRIDPDDY